MNLEHATTFLESTARSSGLTFEPDALKSAAAELAASVERDPAGQFAYTPEGYSTAFRIDGSATVEISAAEHVATLIRRHATAASKAKAETPAPATPPARSAPRDPWAAFDQGLAAKHDAAMIRATEAMQNPWLAGQINRTNQAIITNKNPALAARYKRDAGL